MAAKSAKEVGLEVVATIRDAIRDYEDDLVAMRRLEVDTLKKGLFGLPAQTPSEKEMQRQHQKPVRSVFDIIKKSEDLYKAENGWGEPKFTPTQSKNNIIAHSTCPKCGVKIEGQSISSDKDGQKEALLRHNDKKRVHQEGHRSHVKKSEPKRSVFDILAKSEGYQPRIGKIKATLESHADGLGLDNADDRQKLAHVIHKHHGLDPKVTAHALATHASSYCTDNDAERHKVAVIIHKAHPMAKSEDYIDARADADPSKRFHHVGANDHKATDGEKQVPAPGSGGKLSKDGMDPTKPPPVPKVATVKPAAVPGAKVGEAPKAPKAPGAPGMAKDEIPVVKPRTVFDILGKTCMVDGGDATRKQETINTSSLMMSENLEKVAPPGFSEATMHKLKAKYGEGSAFKIAWAAKKSQEKKTKKSEAEMESCPYCIKPLIVCSC